MSTTMSAAMDILSRTVTTTSRGREEDSDPAMEKLRSKLQAHVNGGKLNREEVRDILTRMVLLQTSKAQGFEFRECAKLILDLQGLKQDSRFKKETADDVAFSDAAFTDAIKEL